ncbi:MAG: iron-containing alcohol dehydrogenase family protein [Ruminiclostridium sp.]
MIWIKTPERYLNEPGALKKSGEAIAQIGKNFFIIGGKTALSTVREELFESLKQAGLQFETFETQGYCSVKAIEKFTSLAVQSKADAIIGVGGGSVLDLAKVVGQNAGIPLVTVPTIAATCAAWSALTVVYTENGAYSHYIQLSSAPRLVIADTRVLAEAPARYLRAGIADTLVKWYENAPHELEDQYDISLRIGLQTAKLALDILYQNAEHAIKDANEKIASRTIMEVIDAIIILAGLVGSITTGHYRASIAHPLHDSFTKVTDTHHSLHGEIVNFGLIVQFVLEGKSTQDIKNLLTLLNKLDLPVTLEQLGISNSLKETASKIARNIAIPQEALDKLNFKVNTSLITQAILTADQLGSESLEAKQKKKRIS